MTTATTTRRHAADIARFRKGASKLRAGVAGLSKKQLHTRCAPGAWSIHEIVVHMVDTDLAARHRMRQIVAQDSPLLMGYDHNAMIDRLDSKVLDTAKLLDLFELHREITAAWLESLPAKAFARAGIHSQYGKFTLGEILAMYAGHVDHHDKFVKGKRKTLKA